MNGLYFYCALVGAGGAFGCAVMSCAVWDATLCRLRLKWRVAASLAFLLAGAGFAAISGWGFEHALVQEASK